MQQSPTRRESDAVRFEPGLVSVTFRQLAPEALIDLAARVGLAAIEWGADIHVPPGDDANAARVAEATRAAGLTVSSYGSYLRMPSATVSETAAVMDTAAALGAPMVRIWPGERNRDSASYSAAERDAVARAIDRTAGVAADRGLAVGLEYHPGTLTDALSSSAALMEAITAPNVHLYWQPSPGIAEDAAFAEIAALGRHIAHLHVFRWDAARVRYPLADGLPLWERWVRAIPQGRWQGPRFAMLEFVANDDPQNLGADAQALHRLIARPD